MTPTQGTIRGLGSLDNCAFGAMEAKRSQTFSLSTGKRETARHGEISRQKGHGKRLNGGSGNSVKKSQRSENAISAISRSFGGRSRPPLSFIFFALYGGDTPYSVVSRKGEYLYTEH